MVNMTIDHNIVLNGNSNDERHGLPAGTVNNRHYNLYLDYHSTGGFKITNNSGIFQWRRNNDTWQPEFDYKREYNLRLFKVCSFSGTK
jgi:hypothetical protein